ncbi:hypothetical protein ACU4GI_20315 [Cupriavidus basilensis]
MTLTISDPFCQQLNADLAAFEADLSRALPFTLRTERDTLVKLVAGLTVVLQCIAGKAPPTGELNAVLAARLGNGYSWLTCLQFLSGARAREAFAKHEAVLRTLVSPALADFAQEALPTMPKTLQAIMADTRAARAGHAAR